MTTDRFVCLTHQLNFVDLGGFSGPGFSGAFDAAFEFAHKNYDVHIVVCYSTAETMRNQLNSILLGDE
jgi:hypothetical protein